MPTTTRHIGMLAYDGANGMDIAGPNEVFHNANALAQREAEAGKPCQEKPYGLHVIGLEAGPIVTESGLRITPGCNVTNVPMLDTLIVPGGEGLRDPTTNARVAGWIERHTRGIRRIASICTGIYGIAPTGLLDGRRVATHWRFAADVRRRFPALQVDGDAVYAIDGRFYTSAGISSGIDLALALVEQDLGSHLALATAREMVVYLRRPGGQSQFSEPLRFQTRSTDRFADLAAWMVTHLAQDLSVPVLAKRACLGERQFRRCFIETFDCTPAAYVEELRMGEARTRLSGSETTIESIAASIGFRTADVFRRAFERKFGVSPADYRRGFGSRRAASTHVSLSKTSPGAPA